VKLSDRLRAALSAAKRQKPRRHITLVHDSTELDVGHAEVDLDRERYSPAKFVALQRSIYLGENPEQKGRAEFSRYIRSLRGSELDEYWLETDQLIDGGALWTVLTPEEVEAARQRVLARKDEIQADAARPMHRSEMAPALRNALVADADRMPTVDELLGLPAFPAVEEDGEDDND
jgi:hypothetical protein